MDEYNENHLTNGTTMHAAARWLLFAIGCAHASIAVADEVLVGVAASFMPPMTTLAIEFERATGHVVELASGSTGALYAQAVNGAPFDLFVAADADHPRLLARAGVGLDASRATIALGRLVIFSADADLIESEGIDALRNAQIRHIAIANPRVAPYGLAATETLRALGLWETLAARLVRGESVAQTFAMIATRNAEIGFVALAQVVGLERNRGAWIAVPQRHYSPIEHDLIVLADSGDHAATQALRAYLLSDTAGPLLESFGYSTARD